MMHHSAPLLFLPHMYVVLFIEVFQENPRWSHKHPIPCYSSIYNWQGKENRWDFFSGFNDPEECVRIIMRNYWSGRKKLSIWKAVRRKLAVTFWLWREKSYNHTASDIVPVSLLSLEKKLSLYVSILQRDSRSSKWDKILEKDPSRFYNMKKSTTRKLKKKSWRDKKQQELNNYSKAFFTLSFNLSSSAH